MAGPALNLDFDLDLDLDNHPEMSVANLSLQHQQSQQQLQKHLMSTTAVCEQWPTITEDADGRMSLRNVLSPDTSAPGAAAGAAAASTDGQAGGKPQPQPSPLQQNAIPQFTQPAPPPPLAALGATADGQPLTAKDDLSSRYCYRHRPDLKMRKQADEPSIETLQDDLKKFPAADQQGISQAWALFSAAPPSQRKLILQGILAQCCFPQLSIIAASVRQLVKIDFISALPDELAIKILCFLDPASICRAAQVCTRWRKLADDDSVWHKMCEQHIDRKCYACGWGLPLLDRKRLRRDKKHVQMHGSNRSPDAHGHIASGAAGNTLNSGRTAPDTAQQERAAMQAASLSDRINGRGKRPADWSNEAEETAKRARRNSLRDDIAPSPQENNSNAVQPRLQPWKDVYRDRFKIGYNWRHGRCTVKSFVGHTSGILCLQFDGNLLATGSYDATIRLWDIDAGKQIRCLKGHTNGVRCLHFDDSKLISGSQDKTVKVWDLKSGRLLRTLTGHKDGVLSLHLDHHLLASGSLDKTIKVWNFNDPSTFVLRGHTDSVNCVKVDAASRTLFSASDDNTVRLWDLDSKTCFKIFKGHVGPVQTVLALPPGFDAPEFEDAAVSSGRNDQGGYVITAADTVQSPTSSNDAQARRDSSTSARSTTAPTANGAAAQTERPAQPPQPNNNIPPAAAAAAAAPAAATTNRTAAVPPHTNGVSPMRVEPPMGPMPEFGPDRIAPPRYILTGGLDTSIRLWDVSVGQTVQSFFGHLEGVWSLAADTLRVVSGGTDGMTKIWDPRTGKCERTFSDHRGQVTCVALSDRRFCTGGEDCDVRMYNFSIPGEKYQDRH